MKKIEKPQPGEYAPYATMYIDLLPNDGLRLQHLQDNLRATKDFISIKTGKGVCSKCAG